MIDPAPSADALEQEAQLAWQQHCARLQSWVTQGRLSAEAVAYACAEWGKEVWIRAYLRARRRSLGLTEFEGLDELD